MKPLLQRVVAGKTATIAHTTRADGDLSTSTVDAPTLAIRRAACVDLPWVTLRQIHSARAVQVGAPTDHRDEGDALVCAVPNVVVAVHSGDCVPVGFISDAGAVAAAHAGWKGLEAGVLESTVAMLRSLTGHASIVAAVGPHIHAARYAFGDDDLDRLAQRFGPQVRSTTLQDEPALDLTAAVQHELHRLDVQVAVTSPDCTAEHHTDYWSHRARQESGRIALVAWMEPTHD